MTGFVRRPLLGPAAILVGPARIRGSLYDFGEYPGLVLDDGDWVVGELYRLTDLAARLPALDRAEGYDPADEAGSLYVRRAATVTRARRRRGARRLALRVQRPARSGAAYSLRGLARAGAGPRRRVRLTHVRDARRRTPMATVNAADLIKNDQAHLIHPLHHASEAAEP